MSLSGKRVVVTRALRQADELNDLLRARGALPLPYPCIAFAPPEDTTLLDKSLHSLHEFDLLLLTSANTVTALAERLEIPPSNLSDADISQTDANNRVPTKRNGPVGTARMPSVFTNEEISPLRVIAVGTATARAAKEQLGLEAEVLSDDFAAEALADALGKVSGLRILLPQSEIASPTLAQRLTDAGAQVTAVTAYRTILGSGGVDLPALLRAGDVDMITFTSPSTVQNLVQRLEAEGGSISQLAGVVIACIGPTTAQAAADAGLAVTMVPTEHTAVGMVAALAQ